MGICEGVGGCWGNKETKETRKTREKLEFLQSKMDWKSLEKDVISKYQGLHTHTDR